MLSLYCLVVYPCRVLEVFTTAGFLATAEIKCLPSNQGEATQETGIHYSKNISSEIDINFQKNNVSFSWSAVLPKINKHYDTVVVFESFFFLSDGYQIPRGVCFGGMTTPPALMPPSDVAHFDKQYLYF